MERIPRYDWVEGFGKVSREQLRTELAAASLMVLVSHEDNCPMVLLEAMSVGMPVLASAVGGIPDLVDDGVNGYLCDSKSPDSIRTALQKLLEDPARAARMGVAGRERAPER